MPTKKFRILNLHMLAIRILGEFKELGEYINNKVYKSEDYVSNNLFITNII